jgi:hypothetical protein
MNTNANLERAGQLVTDAMELLDKHYPSIKKPPDRFCGDRLTDRLRRRGCSFQRAITEHEQTILISTPTPKQIAGAQPNNGPD